MSDSPRKHCHMVQALLDAGLPAKRVPPSQEFWCLRPRSKSREEARLSFKVCSVCARDLPFTMFYPWSKDQPDKLRSYCKDCSPYESEAKRSGHVGSVG